MWGKLRSFFWPDLDPAQPQAWSLDRNKDRIEGERLLKARNYAAAEKHLARLAEDAEGNGYSTAKRVHVRLLLAEALRKQFDANQSKPDASKLEAAEQVVRSAMEMAGSAEDRSAYLRCLDALAEIFADQGNFTAVEKVTQEAIEKEVSLPRPEPLSMARRVHRLGVARHEAGRFADAIAALEKAVSLHEQTYGDSHTETGRELTALGAAYRAHGNHAEAQRCLRRALKIHETTRGIQSPEAMQDVHHLAGSLEESGDLQGAANEYERVLSFKHRMIGGDLDQVAEVQFGLANLYFKWQNYSRARELLMEAVATFKRKGGVRLAVGHETLACVEECSGRYPDAVKQLERAGKAWDALQPERLPELVRNLEHRADLLDTLRREGEASWVREKISQLTPAASVESEQCTPAA